MTIRKLPITPLHILCCITVNTKFIVKSIQDTDNDCLRNSKTTMGMYSKCCLCVRNTCSNPQKSPKSLCEYFFLPQYKVCDWTEGKQGTSTHYLNVYHISIVHIFIMHAVYFTLRCVTGPRVSRGTSGRFSARYIRSCGKRRSAGRRSACTNL